MLRLRPKLGSERGNEWKCCFCLHVRTGTMALGIWHLVSPSCIFRHSSTRVNLNLGSFFFNRKEAKKRVFLFKMLHVMALGVLAIILHEPALLRKLQREGTALSSGEESPAPLPTPLSNIDQPPHPYTNHREPAFVYHDVDMGALVTICTLAITLMLIYGAAKGKPAHILPFFCLQLFDFAITAFTATGYLCYLRSVHRMVAESHHMPWRAQLLKLSPAALSFLVLCAFMMAMLIKAYCISMVWRCYKYLTMRLHAQRSLMPYVDSPCPRARPPPSASLGSGAAPLPDYEEALKQAPPPSYQVATAHLQMDEQGNLVTVPATAVQVANTPAPVTQLSI